MRNLMVSLLDLCLCVVMTTLPYSALMTTHYAVISPRLPSKFSYVCHGTLQVLGGTRVLRARDGKGWGCGGRATAVSAAKLLERSDWVPARVGGVTVTRW